MVNGAAHERVNAMPTKGFFIRMLTRDIALIPAIADLVDNSVDGARRLRGNARYDGLEVRININKNRFRISDNCGGIDVDLARDYAFRFGRDDSAPAVQHSIGRFGVGMKRSIFKMGRAFKVESTTAESRFVLEVDVNEWAQQPDDWHFHFSELEEKAEFASNEIGTAVEVRELLPDVADAFNLKSTKNELRMDLREKMREPISRGLAISLDGIPLTVEPLVLLEGNGLDPAFCSLKFDEDSGAPVNIRLFCGLAKVSDWRRESGWHVFCNGRLVLGGDQSIRTGWGEGIAKFHQQYARVRGYAFFDSDETDKLPWNTTKTDLDADSPIYRSTKPKMILMMKPVLRFLNSVKSENDKLEKGDRGQLETLIVTAASTKLEVVTTRTIFSTPIVPTPKAIEKMQKITYLAPSDDVQRVKDTLKAKTFKEVGMRTFQYYFDAEVGE
jgi:Histidine kinase-, DNA gyrase B-, and HSP90-like ATPase